MPLLRVRGQWKECTRQESRRGKERKESWKGDDTKETEREKIVRDGRQKE